jgi:hypothetical protein
MFSAYAGLLKTAKYQRVKQQIQRALSLFLFQSASPPDAAKPDFRTRRCEHIRNNQGPGKSFDWMFFGLRPAPA